ncbi:hypothetical protein QJS04_geneDACA016749 [Acorus gramineus]|uniref:B-related factor 1 n=1 Tax=Acorus gramineus TaxID=55184 RepID=A0AAV9BGC4_ACOGR|nr:hypothetical protein QJS04_geneDACA016749 [Acorus gramineus]
MPWCKHCMTDSPTERDPDEGYICCTNCGRVIEHDVYTDAVQFEKTSGGQSRLAGTLIRIQKEYSQSHERTLKNDSSGEELHKGPENITCRSCLPLHSLPDLVRSLPKWVNHMKPWYLRGIFTPIPLCFFLPSTAEWGLLFAANSLLGERNSAVSNSALRIIASMKRDWMQTGRKPSGLCGAALYVATLAHGLKYSKSEIVNVVHICEATLTKRLIEFENTESGGLTIEELEGLQMEQPILGPKKSGITEVLCEHKDRAPFAHGLCRSCYDEFIDISGGLDGGSEPPAFQRAERQRLIESSKEGKSEEGVQISSSKGSLDVVGNGTSETKQDGNVGISTGHQKVDEDNDVGVDEPESLSDIDDAEVKGYLYDEEEKPYIKVIWEGLNREYLEEQAAKEAAGIVSGDGVKARKERKRKQSDEDKNNPAKTPAEAAQRVLSKKGGFSAKINMDALEKLFSNEELKNQNLESDNGNGKAESDKAANSEVIDDHHQENGDDYGEGEEFGDYYGYENGETGYDYADDDHGAM